jgi:hypothetical protein
MKIGKITRTRNPRLTNKRTYDQTVKHKQPKTFFSSYDVIQSNEYTPDEVGIDDHLRDFTSRKSAVHEVDVDSDYLDGLTDDEDDVYSYQFMTQNPELDDYYATIEGDLDPFDSYVYDDWENDDGWYVPYDQTNDDDLIPMDQSDAKKYTLTENIHIRDQ